VILTESKIIELIKTPLHHGDILEGIRIQDDLKVHVTGEGYQDTLERIIGQKRAMDYGTRELKNPATKYITKKIRDELSRWKNTQGTRKTYRFGSDEAKAVEFRKQLSTVWKNGSMDSFSSFLNDALYTDFGGFAIVEKPRIEGNQEIRDGILGKKTGTPYVIFKALSDIYDFRLTGRKVEYLIIRYSEENGVVTFRVIDDAGDYLYDVKNSKDGKDIVLRKDSTIPNDLGYVPAIQIGNINFTPLNDHVKTSHIFQTIPILEDYLTRHAEHVISEMVHANPLLALKGTKCTYQDADGHACAGGKIWNIDGQEVNCPNCDGEGATVPKNSSEIIIVPELDKEGKTYNPSMIGQYIVPPTDILEHQAKELDELEQKALYSGTGIKSLVKAQIQTATEIVLNLKPLEDKISDVLDNIEEVETFTTDAIGKLIYRDKYEGSEIHYGRKLNIRDENLILMEIEQSKRAGMPITEIRLLYQELYGTKHRNSSSDLERAMMLLDLEPLATSSIDEVEKTFLTTDEVKWLKINFDDYIDMFENEHGLVNLYMSGQKMNTRIKSISEILTKYNEKRKGSQDRKRAEEADGLQREGLGEHSPSENVRGNVGNSARPD